MQSQHCTYWKWTWIRLKLGGRHIITGDWIWNRLAETWLQRLLPLSALQMIAASANLLKYVFPPQTSRGKGAGAGSGSGACGHCSPLQMSFSIHRKDVGGTHLGAVETFQPATAHECKLEWGYERQRIRLMFTDGVIGARHQQGLLINHEPELRRNDWGIGNANLYSMKTFSSLNETLIHDIYIHCIYL